MGAAAPRGVTLQVDAEFAWPGGDKPGALAFTHPLDPAVESAVWQALGAAFPPARDAAGQLTALQPAAGPAGRYRLAAGDGVWFVRVSARWGDPELEAALADFLARDGVSVNALLVAGAPLDWVGVRYRVDVRPFIAGRHFDGSPAQLEAAAALLARCHAALRRFPRRGDVYAAAAARSRRFEATRRRVAGWLAGASFDAFGERADWVATHREWLLEMTANFDPRVESLAGAQCVHGEIHQGNVLFGPDGAAVLVDLEEAVQVYAPPAWDLAYLVQRFVLADDPAPDVLQQRIASVAGAYGDLPALAPMMRQVAWFAMATILDLHVTHRVVTPEAEYQKFVQLERQAAACLGVL